MPATLDPPKLRRRIDLGVPADDDQDQPAPQPPISDAAATDLNQGPTGLSLSSGYTAVPTSPVASGVMGGDQTQPDDFGQQVQAATAVESKGGPSLSELSTSTKKGPPPGYKPPAKADKTPPPEAKPEPTPATDIVAPASAANAAPKVEKAQPVTTPTPAPSPSPAPGPAPDMTPPAQPVQGQPAQPQTQEKPASLQDPKFVKRKQALDEGFFAKNQDYSQVSEDDRNDPQFAGVSVSDANHPPRAIFMDNRGLYIRDDTAPGEWTKHYFNAQYGDKDYETGVPVKDDIAIQNYKEASEKLSGILTAQTALKQFQDAAQKFKETGHSVNPIQQQELATQNDPNAAWWQRLLAYGGGNMPGPTNVSPEQRALDEVRNRVGLVMSQGILKGISARELSKIGPPPVPLTTDPIDVQLQKAQGLSDYLKDQVNAVYTQNPVTARWLRRAQQNQQQAEQGNTGASANVNPMPSPSPSPSPTPTPTPTPAPSPSPSPAHRGHTGQTAHASPSPSPSPGATPTAEEIRTAPTVATQEDYDKIGNGKPFRDSHGVLHYKGVF